MPPGAAAVVDLGCGVRTVDIPVLRRRAERLGGTRTTSGVVSVPESAALASVGLTVMSEVMGGVTTRAPLSGFFGSAGGGPTFPRGWQGGDDGPPPVYTSTSAAKVPASVTSLRDGYRTALARLVEEVRAVGADGAVDVRVEHTVAEAFNQSVWRFLATGTAVRAAGPTRANIPFTAALSATETVAALRAGWVPLGYLACPVMAVRWVDPQSRQQTRALSANGEMTAFTDTVTQCRRQAGVEFALAARRLGADGAVLKSMDVRVGPAVDLAEVSVLVIGTALAQFRGIGGSPPLTVLSLGADHD
jgi:uncharacterized protein YbjQ (UPF0145 family)